jgi:hypothetical protein
MIRPATLLLAGLVVGAAHARVPPPPPLPLPPTPPANARADQSAPVPYANPPSATASNGIGGFRLRIYSLDEHDSGSAYIPGSGYSAPLSRKPMQTPGFSVSLPFK